MAHVIWLTGMSGSGKTTLAQRLEEVIRNKKGRVEVLDGDNVREYFGNDLGFSRQERIMNVKRIAFAAHMLAKNGVDVLVANIAPYYEVRDFIREQTPSYVQIYLKATTDMLKKRDVKGHYAKVERGEMKDMIGVDDAYDVPRNPDLVIDTDSTSIDNSVNAIVALLQTKGVLGE